MFKTVWVAALALFVAGCTYHPVPPHGHGGMAEWDYPYDSDVGEVDGAARRGGGEDRFVTPSYETPQPRGYHEYPDPAGVFYDQPPSGRGLWSYRVPHPDYLPTVFRTTELRLRRHQEGCAVHYLPAFVSMAERQWNKALRAFAGELYQDAYNDLRQLNLRLDEIDHRMAVIHGPRGSYTNAGCVRTDPTLPCPGSCVGPAFSGGYCGAIRAGHMGPAVIGPIALYGCAKYRQQWPCNDCNADYQPMVAPMMPMMGVCMAPVASAPPVFVQGVAAPGEIATTFSGNLFDHDRDEVKPGFAAYLVKLAQFVRTDPSLSVVLHGHADQSGTNPYNDDLSARRAANVQAILMQNGVAPQQIRSASYGETVPAPGSNPGPDGREPLDRRVEIFLSRGATGAFWTGYCSGMASPPQAQYPHGQYPQGQYPQGHYPHNRHPMTYQGGTPPIPLTPQAGR